MCIVCPSPIQVLRDTFCTKAGIIVVFVNFYLPQHREISLILKFLLLFFKAHFQKMQNFYFQSKSLSKWKTTCVTSFNFARGTTSTTFTGATIPQIFDQVVAHVGSQPRPGRLSASLETRLRPCPADTHASREYFTRFVDGGRPGDAPARPWTNYLSWMHGATAGCLTARTAAQSGKLTMMTRPECNRCALTIHYNTNALDRHHHIDHFLSPPEPLLTIL